MSLWTWKFFVIKVFLITAQINDNAFYLFYVLVNKLQFDFDLLIFITYLFYADFLLVYLNVADRQAAHKNQIKLI